MIRVVILIAALGAGGLAAWLMLGLSRPGAPVIVAPARAPTAEVLVAAADLGQGQAIAENNVRWQAWPETAVNESYIVRSKQPDAITKLAGSIARAQILGGEPIREAKLARLGSGLLAAVLPSGKRAVAVRVSAENTAGGFILPNDRVDVIQTVTRQAGDGQVQNLSRTILTNVRVLAIDQKADETKGETFVVGKTATLELEPAQAETVAAAQAGGILSLALRSVADGQEQPTTVAERQDKLVRIIRAGRSEIVQLR